MELGEVLDMMVITLLLVAVVYGSIVNRKIEMMRRSNDEREAMFGGFDRTITRAQTTIEELKQASVRAEDELQGRIDQGKLLIDDLSFLNERASIVADKMMDVIRNERHKERHKEHHLGKIDVDRMPTAQDIKRLKHASHRNAHSHNPANGNHDNKGGGGENQSSKREKILESLLRKITKSRDSKPLGNSESTLSTTMVEEALEALKYDG